MDKLYGDIDLTYTKGGEPFRPLGSVQVLHALEGEAAMIDKGGIISRYWNYYPSERGKVDKNTANAMLLIEDLSNLPIDAFGELLKEAQNTIIKYIGGQIEPYILNSEKNSVELGVQGRLQADDSQIPQLEKDRHVATKVLKIMPETVDPALQRQKKSNVPMKKKPPIAVNDQFTLKSKLEDLIQKALNTRFPGLGTQEISLDQPEELNHGDYACNLALKLTKELKLPPQEIAEKIADQLKASDLLEKVEIAGPGFINLFLSKQALHRELKTIIEEKDHYGSLSKIDKTIVVEYSSPNIAKPLGAHHLITTILGQSLYNILQKAGFNCISVNYLGDWGTQFGKLLYAYKHWGDKKVVEKDPISELLKLYIKFHEEAEKNPTIEDEARHQFKIFEKGDSENRQLWQWFVDVSLQDLQKTYERLGGIQFDHNKGESFVEDQLKPLLKEGQDQGVFVPGEEGSLIVEYADESIPPFLVQKKDGATLYSTRDLATLKWRIENWHPDRILYVVDSAQRLHFLQLFTAASRFDWYHGEGEHVSFGRMHLKEGKMSTRKGTVILMEEVLDEALSRAKAIIEEKSPQLSDKEKVAEALAMGAIKYNILSQNRGTDITFDWDRMLSFEGNSAPYLQYTYARARSLNRKSNEITNEYLPDPDNAHEKIQSLLRFFPKFSDAIAFAARDYKPNIISNYLFKLAQYFNAYYNAVPILKTEDPREREFRLTLAQATAQIIKNGLQLLGVEVVEEM